MFKKLDTYFKRCDEFLVEKAKASVALFIQETRQEIAERIRKELQLLESLQRQNISLNDAIINRRHMLQVCEKELEKCDIYA